MQSVTLSSTSSLATTLEPTSTSTYSDSVFLINEDLSSASEFFGRAGERQKLMGRIRKGASTSIVGPSKIGKRWLMDYLKLVAKAELGPGFLTGFLNAGELGCKTVTAFTIMALKELAVTSHLISSHTDLGLEILEEVVKELRARGVIPILCIYEFDILCNRPAFDSEFFQGLRAITRAGLVLVVASKDPLIDLQDKYGITSDFFNVFETIHLKPFNYQEAKDFIDKKGNQAGFTELERINLLKYGRYKDQWPPLRQQLAGEMLLNDKIHRSYRLDSHNYWQGFEERLTEVYRYQVGSSI